MADPESFLPKLGDPNIMKLRANKIPPYLIKHNTFIQIITKIYTAINYKFSMYISKHFVAPGQGY